MSGIVGIIDFNGQAFDPEHIGRMTQALAHRGPDGISHWQQPSQALGYCAYHTTLESSWHPQPFRSDDGQRVLVMDGRLDNWEPLRRTLGEPDAGDIRLVMRAYERWGEDFAGHLEGDFAIAIWDRARGELHCARDMFASRPFYYHWADGRFSFASEIGALALLPWITLTLNDGMVAELLSFDWRSRTETFWNEVHKLEPRRRYTMSRDGIDSAYYWEPDLHLTPGCKSDDEFREHYRTIFEESVRRVSRSQAALAFEVSGGLDSSSAYVQAIELQRAGRLLAPGMRGYTLEFPPNTPADELRYALAVGEKTGTEIVRCAASHKPMAWYRDLALSSMDIPVSGNSVMADGLFDAARCDGARVVMSGWGGDEWAGARTKGLYYADLLAEQDFPTLRRAFRSDAIELGLTRTIWWLARYGVVNLFPEDGIRALARKLLRSRWHHKTWLSSRFRKLVADRPARPRSVAKNVARPSQRLLLHYLDSAPIALTTDWHEFWCTSKGVEYRSPFNSRGMVQFAFSTSEWMRQRGLRHRWLHREALGDLLPGMVRDRTDKADFMVTILDQNREIRAKYADSLLDRCRDWVDETHFRKIIENEPNADDASFGEWLLLYLTYSDVLASRTETGR